MAVSINSYLTKNGLIAVFFLDSNGNFTNLHTVVTTPSFFLNGSETPMANIQGPFWQNSHLNCPWVLYQPPTPFQTTDTVTMTTVSGWATTAAGTAPVVTNAGVPNYVGQYEPSVGKYGNLPVPGFNQPSSEWKMPVNYVISWGGKEMYWSTFTSLTNSIYRGYTPSNVTSKDSHGHPLTISATSIFNPIQTGQGGALDGIGIPTLLGTWQLVADESNPSQPMTVAMSVSSNCTVTGPVITGNTIGKTWTWEVQYVTNPTTRQVNTYFHFSGTGSGGSGNWTLSNECILQPGNKYRPTTNPWTMNQNTINQLTSSSGNNPYYLRWMDSVEGFGQSNAVLPSDLLDTTQWVWGNGTNHILNVTAVRNFDPAVSPYVYFSQEYPGTTQPGGGPPGAPYALPTSAGFMNFTGPLTGWYMVEIVYDNSEFQIKSGQVFTFESSGSLTAIPATNGNNGTTTVDMSLYGGPAFVTSPTTFVCSFWGGNFTNTTGQPGGINNVVGTTNVTVTGTVSVPDNGSIGHGPSAAATGCLPYTNYWANFNALGTDDLYSAAIADILDNLPEDRYILCEYGNEVWNYGFNAYWLTYVLGNTGGYGSGVGQTQAGVRRTAEMHNICYNAAAAVDRGDKIVRSFGSFYVGPYVTTAIVNYINSWNESNPDDVIMLDAIHVAPYLGGPQDSTLVNACASVYAHNPASVQYNNPYPWTRSQWWDAYRHYTKYNSTENGPTGYINEHVAALSHYVPVGTQPEGFIPVVIGYEGGTAVPAPAGVSSPNNSAMNQQLAYDLMYDPGSADQELASYQSWQFAGMSMATIYSLCMPRSASTSTVNYWLHYIWDGQQAGYGTNNTFFADTGVSNDFGNVSPRGWAWKLWMDAVKPVSKKTAPYFPGLYRRR